MDKEHMELKLLRKLSVKEFAELAAPIWGAEGKEIAERCRSPLVLLVGAGGRRVS